MLIQSQAGPLPASRQAGGLPYNPAGTFGEAAISRIAPDYYPLVKAGVVFAGSYANCPISAGFNGAANGAGMLALWNPANSGVDMLLLSARLAMRNDGGPSAAASTAFWLAPMPSLGIYAYLLYTAINLYPAGARQSKGGYIQGSSPGQPASSLLATSLSIQAATATSRFTVLTDDIKGILAVPPGNLLTWGCSVGLSGSADLALTWAELPI